MTYEFTNNILTVNGKTVIFNDNVDQVIDFGNCLVVLTDYYKAKTNENVYGINEMGEKIWQIKKMGKLYHQGKEFIGITNPYSSLTKIDDNRVTLHNWDSTTFDIEPMTGKLLTQPLDSRRGRRPW